MSFMFYDVSKIAFAFLWSKDRHSPPASTKTVRWQRHQRCLYYQSEKGKRCRNRTFPGLIYKHLRCLCPLGLQRGPKITSLVARQVHTTFASDSRMWPAHPAWIWRAYIYVRQMLHEIYNVRHVAHVIMQMLRATRDVTFGPLICSWMSD
jgi:hypothetical protein